MEHLFEPPCFPLPSQVPDFKKLCHHIGFLSMLLTLEAVLKGVGVEGGCREVVPPLAK